jgi:threonine dehydratase
LDKLHATHNPTLPRIKRQLEEAKIARVCALDSEIINVEEHWATQAIEWAHALGITTEPSGIASLALYLQIEKNIPADAKVCVVNTGKLKLVNNDSGGGSSPLIFRR